MSDYHPSFDPRSTLTVLNDLGIKLNPPVETELREAVLDLIHFLRTGPFDFRTGVCCCGDDFVSHHGWENHSYTDEGQYTIDKAMRNVLEKM